MEKLNIQLFAGYMFEIEVTITNGVFTYCSAGGDAIVDNGTRVTKLVASSSLPVTIIAEASSGYELPETTQLNANSGETVEYTWNKSTGTLSINSVSGECAVTGTLICTASASDISKINLGGNTYNIKDAYLRKPNGENELIANNKIATTYLPDYILGQLLYGGTVTGAGVATLSTNAKTKLGTTSTTITLTNNNTAITGYVANEGIYYVVSSNGSFASLDLKTGDWLISTGSAWKKIDNTDEVTSVQISATSPVASSTSSSQTGSVSTTISLENNYGDTKNPYGNKSKNLVLASPSTTTGSPSFRSLVEDDIPSLSESKITNLTTDLASKVNLSDIKVVNNGYKHVVTFNYTSYIVYGSTVSYNGIQFSLSNNVANLNTYSAIASALYNGSYTSPKNALATDNNISQTESGFTITVYGLYSEDGTNIKARVYDSHYSSYTSGTLSSSYMSSIVDNSNEILAVVLNDNQTLITTGMDLYGSNDRPSYNNNLLALLSDVPDGIQTITDSTKIIDLDTGIYKLSSNSYFYIYYSGSSTSSTYSIPINPQYGGSTFLYVTKHPYGSMGTSYIWSWFVVVPDGNNITTNMICGYTNSTTGSYNTINLNRIITSVKTLNTNNTTAQSASATESISGSGYINLHKISKTGTYTDLLKKPTDTYDTSSTYNSGDVCIYNGNMYKCNTNSTTGTWDSTKWDAIISGGSGPSFVNGIVGANNDVEGIKVYDSLYPSQSTVYGNSIKNTRNNVDCYINLPFHDFNNTGNTLTTVECTYIPVGLVYDISTGSFDSSSFNFDSVYAEDLMELINDYNSIYFVITDEYGEEKYYTLRASEMVPDDDSDPTSYTIYATGIASNKENSSLLSGPIQATLVFEKEYDPAPAVYVFNLNSTSSSLTQLGGGGGTTVTFVDWS